MTERLTFDASPEATFADLERRVIKGIAIPKDAVASSGGRRFRFAAGSVVFGERTPLLAYHDVSRPVGRLTSHEWTDQGLQVAFAVSKTDAGDEALVLASDGVLGLSVGVDIAADGAKTTGDITEVTFADGREISLTPVPAFREARVLAVAMHDQERTVPVTEAPEVTPVTVNLATDGFAEAVAQAFAALPAPQAQPVVQVMREEAPYRFDGQPGQYGFVADMRESQAGDGEAAQRLQRFIETTFAVDSAATAPLNPTGNRPDLYVGPLRYSRPLAGLISTGGLQGNTPFVVPKFGTASNLVAPHVEMVEPTLATWTATSQTITPGAVSGKAEISREAWENSSPQIDGLVWQEMVAAHAEALEERIANLLDGLTLTPVAVTGTDSALIDDITDVLVDLQFTRGGNRYTSFAVNADLYKAVVGAKDADGRKLLPILGPTNADGTTSASYGRFLVGSTTGVPVWGLDDHSYLLVPSSVWQWSSAPRRLTFDIQVKSIFIGLWAYAAEAVLRDSDVKRIDFS